MTHQEMARTQHSIMASQCRVVWIEPNGSLEEGDSRLWPTQPHHCLPKLENCAGVVAVERDRRLELHLRLAQSGLQPPEYPHRNVRHRAVRILLESFEEQMFGPCFILLRRAAPSGGDIAEQSCCDADPRIDGSRVDLERALEIRAGLLQPRPGTRPVKPSPSAHDEIARVGIDCSLQLYPAP